MEVSLSVRRLRPDMCGEVPDTDCTYYIYICVCTCVYGVMVGIKQEGKDKNVRNLC